MKKLRFTIILLSTLLIMALFMSCEVESNDIQEQAVGIRFRTDDNSRTLTAERDSFSSSSYYWYYTAEKADGGPSSGKTSGETKIGDTEAKGLDAEVGSFSLGKWNFTLKAYTSTEESKVLVYSGTANGYSITEDTTTIDITVEPQTGEKGTLKISEAIKFTANGVEYTASSVTVSKVGESTSVANPSASGGYYTYSLDAGSYKVIVAYTNTENETKITYATNTIFVNVWNGLTTTISGTLDEITVKATFAAVENSSNGSISQTTTIKSNSEATYAFDYSPASYEFSGSSNTLGTTVKGKFINDSSSTGTLTVVTYPITSASDNTSFVVGDDDTGVPVAGIDVTLSGATIESGSVVIITTYVAKSLTSPKMYHKNVTMDAAMSESAEAVTADGDWWYDSGSGKLVFATSSFSSFFMSSPEVAVITTVNTAYDTLRKLFSADEYKEGAEVVIVSDASDSKNTYTEDSANTQTFNPLYLKSGTSINLNGHTITFTGNSTAFATAADNNSKEIVLRNGKIIANNMETKFDANGNATRGERLIRIETSNSTLTIDSVEINTNGSAVLVKKSTDNVTLTINKSTITVTGDGFYALSTNAEPEASDNATFKITDSILSCEKNTAVLFNVKGGITMNNSTVIGGLQGMLLRGGESHKITNSTIKSYNWNYEDSDESGNFYYTGYTDKNLNRSWGQGNNAAVGNLVIGNKSNGYKYPTTVVLDNVEFDFTNDTTDGDCSNIFIWQNKIKTSDGTSSVYTGDETTNVTTYNVMISGSVKGNKVSVNEDTNGANLSFAEDTDVTKISFKSKNST